jgi:hypothetical protein
VNQAAGTMKSWVVRKPTGNGNSEVSLSIKDAFASVDTDGSGTLSIAELKVLLSGRQGPATLSRTQRSPRSLRSSTPTLTARSNTAELLAIMGTTEEEQVHTCIGIHVHVHLCVPINTLGRYLCIPTYPPTGTTYLPMYPLDRIVLAGIIRPHCPLPSAGAKSRQDE